LWVLILSMILLPFIVDVFKVESMNMTRQITEQSKENVDTQIDSTALDQEDSERRNEDLE
jgi:hypothetical protein